MNSSLVVGLFGASMLTGCLSPVDVGENRQAQQHQQAGDAGCAWSGPVSTVVPITFDEAGCLGVISAPCAACHQSGGTGCWEARPQVGGMPPSAAHTGPTLASCRAPSNAGCTPSGPVAQVVPLTLEQAGCAGLTPPACAGCHQKTGCFELRPAGVPVPDASVPVPASCGIDAGR